MNALIKLENATRMLAEIRDAKDAKKLMDMADAAQVFARKAKLGEEAEAYARGIKIDAQTVLGGFINQVVDASTGRPKPSAHGGQVLLKSLRLNKHVQQDARHLAEAKEKAPALHALIRNGEKSIRKLPQLLRTPAERKEAERLQRVIFLTKEYEYLAEMATALHSFHEFDPDKGRYRDKPKLRLTPARLHEAGANLIRVARLWRQHEEQKGTTTK